MSNKFDKMTNSTFSKTMNFVYKILVINLLYIFTTALGLIFFTFIPATIATFVCMKGINDQEEFPIAKSFLRIFKEQYKNGILLTIYYSFTFLILTYAFSHYLNSTDTLFNTVGLLVISFLLLVQLASIVHVLLVSLYTPNIKIRSKIKYSYLMVLYSPILTIFLVLLNGLMLILSYVFITFSFIFTFAFMAYYNVVISKKTYQQVSKEHTPLTVIENP